MNSDIQITLDSLAFDSASARLIPQIKITGATINYGINRLPSASVHIDPVSLNLLCDFDKLRRTLVRLTIKTSDRYADGRMGCLYFDGLIDGISISQQPGSLVTSIILRHRFTLLNEVYPRCLGLNAGGTNMFALFTPVTYNPSSLGSNQTSLNGFYNNIAQGVISLNTEVSIIDYIINVCKQIVKLVAEYRLNPGENARYNGISDVLQAVINAQNINALALEPMLQQMLSSIDTSLAQLSLTAGRPTIAGATFASRIVESLSSLEETLFGSMIRLISDYNCIFVVANEKAFIVPEAAYLKIENGTTPSMQQNSKQPNIAFPGDYEQLTFNDHGENTVKGVYVVPESLNTSNAIAVNPNLLNGYYADANTGTQGNIVMKTLPMMATSYLAYMGSQGSPAFQKSIASKTPMILNSIYIEAVEAAQDQFEKFIENDISQPTRDFLNKWAELEYCKIKYGERTGSITLPFNKNWVPGAPGKVYLRNPGTYIAFFVTDVQHNFSLSPASSGNANTTISFKGGRPGAATNVGLSDIPLYTEKSTNQRYNFDSSQTFCKNFIANISAPL